MYRLLHDGTSHSDWSAFHSCTQASSTVYARRLMLEELSR
jgi:hypothetical protein